MCAGLFHDFWMVFSMSDGANQHWWDGALFILRCSDWRSKQCFLRRSMPLVWLIGFCGISDYVRKLP
jgi:hypothetical protein